MEQYNNYKYRKIQSNLNCEYFLSKPENNYHYYESQSSKLSRR